MISDYAFNQTLWALQVYGEYQGEDHPKNAPKMLLRLTKNELGQPVLQPIYETDLGFIDRCMRFLGIGGCTLSRVVNFLQSKAVFEKLETTTLNETAQHTIQRATHYLDGKIKKSNENAFFPITTLRRNLSQTIREHFHKLCYSNAISRHVLHKKAVTYAQPNPINKQIIAPHLHPVAELLHKGEFVKAKQEISTLPVDELSKNELLAIATGRCKLELAEELLSGKAVVDASGVLHLDPKKTFLRECHTLFPEMPDLSNWALVIQEIRRSSNKTQAPLSKIEMQCIKAQCTKRKLHIPTNDQILRLQKSALEHLLKGDLPHTKKELERTKQKAYLSTCKVPEAEHSMWQTALAIATQTQHFVTQAFSLEAEKLISEIKMRSLPPIAEEKLLKACTEHTTSAVSRYMAAFVQKSIPEICALGMPDSVSADVHLNAADSFSTFRQQRVLPRFHFYIKWQKYLTKEMAQGHKDSGEDLGAGICWALSLRWVAAELTLDPKASVTDAVSKMKMGKTFAKDRKVQAAYGITFKHPFRKASSKQKLGLNLHHPKKVLKAKDVTGAAQIIEQLRLLGQNKLFQSEYKGVGQLGFNWPGAGHAICIVCRKDMQQPSKSVLRFSEPNFGTYDFKVEGNSQGALAKAEHNLYSCLAELITTIYSQNLDFLECTGFQLTLPKPPTTTPSAAA